MKSCSRYITAPLHNSFIIAMQFLLLFVTCLASFFLKRKRSVKCKSVMNKFCAGFLMSVFLFCFCFLTEVYDNRFYMKGLHQLHSETPLQEDRLHLPQVLSKLALIFKFGRKKCWVYIGDAQSVWTTDFSIFNPAS